MTIGSTASFASIAARPPRSLEILCRDWKDHARQSF